MTNATWHSDPADLFPPDLTAVEARLRWMRAEHVWPNGLRYLWTDAFGVVLLVSLFHARGDPRHLAQAEGVMRTVERVLGRPRGLRIGEAADRDGQYFHYLAMWLYALHRLGGVRPEYRERAIALARAIHPRFVVPGVGVPTGRCARISAAPTLASASAPSTPITSTSSIACSPPTLSRARSPSWARWSTRATANSP